MNNVVCVATLVALGIVVISMTNVIVKYFDVIGKNPDADSVLSTPFLIGLGFVEVFGLVLIGILAFLVVS